MTHELILIKLNNLENSNSVNELPITSVLHYLEWLHDKSVCLCISHLSLQIRGFKPTTFHKRGNVMSLKINSVDN